MPKEIDSPLQVTWILPAYNEAAALTETVSRIRTACLSKSSEVSRARVLIVENGSDDKTWEVAQSLETRDTADFEIRAMRSNDRGLGFAYAIGIEAASQFELSEAHWILASASDLPFGLSDFHEFLARAKTSPVPHLLIGSKRHPKSSVKRSLTRQALTFIFFFARKILLGTNILDSQGTFFVRAQTARKLLLKTQSRDFFFSTEFIFHAERTGLLIEEVPVVLEPELRKSSVRPFHDGLNMLSQILRLWLSTK